MTQIKVASSDCEVTASLALMSNKEKERMGREEDLAVSDDEVSPLQSSSGEDYDEDSLQPPPEESLGRQQKV